MPGKVKVKVVAGKNLPVMDRSNDTTDAYVEVKLGNVTYKTDVFRKSLNPQWNSEWFRFEMDDLELQDEPLQIRLMDHDTYSANDSIGKVYIDLNPLLTNPSKTKEPSGRSMNGWIPVYDTMHGIRGEVNLMVKVELFSDLNKFRQSSCGVKFFFSSNIPEGHQAIQLHGFVEELVVNDDPEYQWIDKIRTPRASNEARQTLFSKISGEVQRRVGLKALELGGNAVIGYRQCFDLEGESGIVVRGIGTAATLTKSYDTQLSPIPDKEFLLDGQLTPRSTRPHPSPSSNQRPFYSKSTSLVTTAEPSYASSRLTTTSMPDSILRRLNANNLNQDFGEQSLAEVIMRLSNTTEASVPAGQRDPSPPTFQRLSPSHRNLTPQTSCDSSIITFRRGSLLESDEEGVTDPDGGETIHRPSVHDTPSPYNPNRHSKKKDKYSTTGLMKRANFTILSLPSGGSIRSTDKLRDEFMRFFKRGRSIQVLEPKSKTETGPYRKPRIRRDIFSLGSRIRRFGKKRQRRNTELRRSTSDSYSVGRQSLESLPSLCSEDLRFGHDWSGTENYPSSSGNNPRIFDMETIIPSPNPTNMLGTHVQPTPEMMEAFKGIRYERPTDEPLRLYISSIDALLVCNPSQEVSLGASNSKLPASSSCRLAGGRVPMVTAAGVGVDGSECMASTDGAALVGSNREKTNFSLSANNELTFLNVLGVPSPGERSGSASGGGSKEEIQMHDEGTTSCVTTFPPTASISEPIPEEQYNSSNENSLAEGKVPSSDTKIPELPPNSNPPHLPHDTKSTTTNGRPGKGPTTSTQHEHGGSANNMNLSNPQPPRVPSSVSPIKTFPTNTSGGIGTNGRRSSESDLSTPPKGILNSSIQAMLSGPHGKGPSFAPSRRPGASSDHFDMLEYPFITLYDLPPKFIQRIGGSVSARSVKLLERISNLEEPESRDSWWTEIRMEIRSHARSICCNVILGYEETTTICDDVCILSATGTAAVVNSAVFGDTSEGSSKFNLAPLLPDGKVEKERVPSFRNPEYNGVSRTMSFTGAAAGGMRHGPGDEPNCYVCHIPYNEAGVPFVTKMARCGICRKARVPDLILATISIPSGVPVLGKSCLIQAQVFRPKKDCKGESSAKEVSDSLPFLEYELHRRLINKLKVKGMNAIFCLSIQICLGENLIMATATGTALCLAGLPTPELPKITAGNMKTDTQKVCQFQKVVQDAFDKNREFYKVIVPPAPSGQGTGDSNSSDEDSDDDSPLMNLATGNKDTYVLEVDDSEDIEIISELIDPNPPVGFDMSNLEHVLGYDDYTIAKQQMFIHVWRCRIPALTLRQLSAHFDRILRSISFKLRSMRPCILNKIRLHLELPEADEMQVCVTGTALGLKEKLKTTGNESRVGSTTILPTSSSHSPMLTSKNLAQTQEEPEMMFDMEYDMNQSGSGETSGGTSQTGTRSSGGTGGGVAVAAITVSSPSSPVLPRGAGLGMPASTETSPAPMGTSNPRGSITKLYSGGPTSNQNLPVITRSSASPLSAKLPLSPQVIGNLFQPTPTVSPVCSIPPLARSRSSINTGTKARGIIEITTLSHIPGQRIEKYLGNLNFFFIRETTSIKEMGGPTGFVHSFVMEVTAILRGHVSALGGNALVSYFMTELSLLYNPHKNQGQCLISVGGDAVLSLPPNPTSTIQED